MLAWIVLLGLIVVEIIAIRWWLAANYYRFFFNDWAALLYAGVLVADLGVAWLVSNLYAQGGTNGLQLILVLGTCLFIIVLLGTLFFRWVIRLDMTDIKEIEEKRRLKEERRRP